MSISSSLRTGALLVVLAVAFASCDRDSPTSPSPGPCSYTVTPTSLSFDASGGTRTVNVSTESRCTWTATSDRAWMSITGGAAGTGSGVVTVTVTPNTSDGARTGTLTVAGHAVSVQEEGLGACTVEISPSSASYNKDPATGRFSVVAASHCEWTAASTAGWITITSGSSGSGNGTVDYAVERNRALTPRTGTITVGGRTFTIDQAADTPAPLCDYSVTPVEFTPCMSVGYELEAIVTTQQGCTWTAESDASWITVTSSSSNSGPGTVRFTVTDNWDAPRQGVVKLRWPTETAGQNLRVAQAGCFYAVSTASINIAAAGGTGQFNVIQQSEPNTCGGPTQDRCRWSAETDVAWITITTPMPRVGDNPVAFTVAPNPGPSPRTGRITVRDKTVVITQAGQ